MRDPAAIQAFVFSPEVEGLIRRKVEASDMVSSVAMCTCVEDWFVSGWLSKLEQCDADKREFDDNLRADLGQLLHQVTACLDRCLLQYPRASVHLLPCCVS